MDSGFVNMNLLLACSVPGVSVLVHPVLTITLLIGNE